MKTFIFCCCLLSFSFIAFTQAKFQEINPVVHDQSYIDAFGTLPDQTTNEDLRIQIHLSYVEQLLRSEPRPDLTAAQQVNRLAILDILREYLLAGNFPVNRDYPGERRPCFIDADGNICAVGYLIEQTKGRSLAEEINAKHQYDFLLDMNEPVIEAWANEFGLSLKECAMIQPTYGPAPDPYTRTAPIPVEYGIASGVFGGTNVLLNMAIMSVRWKHNPALGYVGLVAGSGQLIIGLANIKSPTTEYRINGGKITTTYKKQNILSYANIAIGTTTIITSALNLAMNKKIRDKRNAVNLYSYPNYNNSVNMGLSFTRRI